MWFEASAPHLTLDAVTQINGEGHTGSAEEYQLGSPILDDSPSDPVNKSMLPGDSRQSFNQLT
jgi:hypothetical protein